MAYRRLEKGLKKPILDNQKHFKEKALLNFYIRYTSNKICLYALIVLGVLFSFLYNNDSD